MPYFEFWNCSRKWWTKHNGCEMFTYFCSLELKIVGVWHLWPFVARVKTLIVVWIKLTTTEVMLMLKAALTWNLTEAVLVKLMIQNFRADVFLMFDFHRTGLNVYIMILEVVYDFSHWNNWCKSLNASVISCCFQRHWACVWHQKLQWQSSSESRFITVPISN